jgi:predicted house-cleaning NTP pyrophosphatase (Maf/HAM1 superfamily)
MNLVERLCKRPNDTANSIARLLATDPPTLAGLLGEYFEEVEGKRANIASTKKPQRLVLVSQSPRRRDLLRTITGHSDFSVLSISCVETIPMGATTAQVVLTVAMEKLILGAWEIAADADYETVLVSADTLIETDRGLALGKLVSDSRNVTLGLSPLEMLLDTVGETESRSAKAFTGVVAANLTSRAISFGHAETLLLFKPACTQLSEKDLVALHDITSCETHEHTASLLTIPHATVRDVLTSYVSSGRYKGKAGGFDIRDRDFFLCVTAVYGDPFNVVGLPFFLTQDLLQRAGCISRGNLAIGAIWPHEAEQQKVEVRSNEFTLWYPTA